MEVKPIRTEADYQRALQTLKGLMNARPGSPEGDQLEVLGTLVEAYEREHFPMELPDPVEAIKFRMEQRGMSRRELETILGGKNRVSEVMNRKRRLTLAMIRGLSKHLDIPADALVKEYKLRTKQQIKRTHARRQAPR